MPEPMESFEGRLRALPLQEPSTALKDRSLDVATAATASPGRFGWAAWAAAAVIAVCAGLNAWGDTQPAPHRSAPPVQAAAPEDPMMKDLEALAGRPLYRGTVRCADGRSILETRRQLEAMLRS